VLRQELQGRDEALTTALFGPRTISDNASSFAGALAVGDAHLLVLPVRALAGILCYATSPFILNRYARDLRAAGIQPPDSIPKPRDDQRAMVVPQSANLMPDTQTLVLEDLDLQGQGDGPTRQWADTIAAMIHPQDAAGREDFCSRFAVLPDNILGFLAETATELRTRISIDEQTGTVKKGALWFEEHLPAESVLWGVYALSDSRMPGQPRAVDDLAQALRDQLGGQGEHLLQLGGQAGVGRGLVRLLAAEVPA
jgi:CRISPR-associated protein Cmr4